MPRITIAGHELDYEHRGAGTDIVFVHGFGASRLSWEPLMTLLEEDFRVTAYSQRGFPPSSEVEDPSDVSLPLLADDLGAMLDALGIERAHLVGSSMGAGVVRRFMLSSPDRVLSAVLDGGHGGGPTPRPADADGLAIEAICAAAQRDMGALADRWCSAAHFSSLRRKQPEAWQAFRDRFAAMPVSTVVNVQRGIRGRGDQAWVSPDDLAGIDTPTLVLFGEEDVPAFQGSLFNAATIPSAGLAVLPGCGHHAHVEEPALYAAVLRNFVDAVQDGRWQPTHPRPHLTALFDDGGIGMTQLDPQRALQLRFQGDWGGVNLTRICGWLAGEVGGRAARGTRSTIRTGRGMGDNLVAVARGEVDVAVSTPGGFARMARAGQGIFSDEPLPGLRAIGCVPHRDAMLVAVPASLGIRSFAQLREQRPALRLALSPNDGESFMGLGAEAIFAASGIPLSDLVAWGGELLFREQPQECVALVVSGEADAILHEAIMTPWWQQMAETHALAFLPLEDDAAQRLEDELSLSTVTVPAGYLPGLDEPIRTVDFRDWMVVVRDDLRDDVAGLLATIMVETSDFFERQYRHLPVRFSPLDYPITPARLADTPIPLHPGAEAYYRSIGALEATDA